MRNISLKRTYKLHIKSIQSGKILDDIVIPCKIININNTTKEISITVRTSTGIEVELYHIPHKKDLLWFKRDKLFSHIVFCGSQNVIQYCVY